MTNLKRRKCMEYNVTILQWYGLWAHKQELASWKSYFFHLLPYAQLFRLSYSLIFQCINVSLVWGDTESMSLHAIVVVFYIVMITKYTNLFFKRTRIRQMVDTLEKLINSNCGHLAHNARVLDKTGYVCETAMKVVSLFWIVGNLVLSVVAMVQGFATRTIQTRLWLPYDYHSSPVFEITLLTSSCLAVVDCFIEFISGSLFVVFLIYMYAQLKILRYNLVNVREIVSSQMNNSEKKNTRSQRLTEFGNEIPLDNSGFQHSAICTVNIDIVSGNYDALSTIDRKKLPQHVTAITERMRMIEREAREKRNLNHEMERFLATWVIHHQTLIKLTLEINTVFKSVLSFQLMLTMLSGLFGLYISAVAKSLIDSKVLLIFVAICCLGAQFFWYCACADLLTNESALIHDAAYACDWLDASERFKRTLRIIMSRAQKPLFMRAAGIPLSRITFRAVLKSAYYLHMVLSKMYFGEELIVKSRTNH